MPYYWFGGPPPTGHARSPAPTSTPSSIGRVAITPIQLDLTARRLLERIRGWDWELAGTPGSDVG